MPLPATPHISLLATATHFIQMLSRYPRLLLVAALLSGLLPFLGKPFHIDDPLFLWSARQIQAHPTDPFGFRVNWSQTERPMSEVTKNPPLACYYIAAAAALAGWSEPMLHAAFLLPALAALLGCYELARIFGVRPLLAALAMLCTPAFFVSSTTVMCDTMMLAFWNWALVCWLRGLEKKSNAWLALAGLLVTAAALTKYFGICLIPLLASYSLLRSRRDTAWLLPVLISLTLLAGYEWWTRSLYGQGMLFEAMHYSSAVRGGGTGTSSYNFTLGLAYAGGSLAVVLFFCPFFWPVKKWFPAAALVGAFTVFIFYTGAPVDIVRSISRHRLDWVAVQFAFWACVGVALLTLAVENLLRSRYADSALLLLWVGGTFIFAVIVNWTVNVRSLLPMAPAVGILLARRWERNTAGGLSTVRAAWALLPAAGLSIAVAHADFFWARAVRNSVQAIAQDPRNRSGTLWFEGHWGFHYYMESLGAKPLDWNRSRIQNGDGLVIPGNNCSIFTPNVEFTAVRQRLVTPHTVLDCHDESWCRCGLLCL